MFGFPNVVVEMQQSPRRTTKRIVHYHRHPSGRMTSNSWSVAIVVSWLLFLTCSINPVLAKASQPNDSIYSSDSSNGHNSNGNSIYDSPSIVNGNNNPGNLLPDGDAFDEYEEKQQRKQSGVHSSFDTNDDNADDVMNEESDTHSGSVNLDGHGQSKVPSKPLKVKAVEVTEQMAHVQWNPPVSSHGGVTKYTVYYNKDVIGSMQISLNTTSAGLIISKLQSGTKFRFYVVAWNTAGKGEASDVGSFKTLDRVYSFDAVEHLAVEGINSRSVKVTFKPPPRNQANITGYRLFYRKADPDQPKSVETMIELQLKLTYHVRGLNPNTKYMFRVVAMDNKKAGRSGETVSFITYTDVPEAPPKVTLQTLVNRDRFKITWTPPDPSKQNGKIEWYDISFRQENEHDVHHEISATAPLEREFTELKAGKTYSVKVAAKTSNGSGPYSSAIQVTLPTEEKVSDYLATVRNVAFESSDSSIVVFWDPPAGAKPNEVIGYKLEWGKDYSGQHTITLPSDYNQFQIIGLQTNTEYFILLRGVSAFGDGMPITEVAYTMPANNNADTLPAPIHFMGKTLSESNVKLSWNYEYSKDLGAPQYEVFHRMKTNDDTQIIHNNIVNSYFEVGGLLPNSLYQFSVRAVHPTVKLYSSFADIITLKTAEAQQHQKVPKDVTITAPSEDKTAVFVTWSPPRMPHRITQYIVAYGNTNNFDEWNRLPVSGDMISANIDGLRPGSMYFFKVKAFMGNNKETDWSYENSYSVPTARSRMGGASPFDRESGLKLDAANATEPDMNTKNIIIIAISCFAFIAIIMLAVIGYCFCRSRRPRNGYKAPPQKKETIVQPPDLWMDCEQVEMRSRSKMDPSLQGSMQELQMMHHTPTPPPVSEIPPRYEGLGVAPPRYNSVLSNNGGVHLENHYHHGGVATLDRRRQNQGSQLGHQMGQSAAVPLLSHHHNPHMALSMSSGHGSDVEGTMPHNGVGVHHMGSGSYGELHSQRSFPRGVSPSTVVYTGPRHEHILSPSSSARQAPPSSMDSGHIPSPPPPVMSLAGGNDRSNPLSSFSSIMNPAPPPAAPHQMQATHHPMHHQQSQPVHLMHQANGQSPRRVPITVGATVGLKQNGALINNVHSGNSPRLTPQLSSAASDAYSSSGRDTDNETTVSHSYSTEELNNQIKNLDVLMKDLTAISTNDFDS